MGLSTLTDRDNRAETKGYEMKRIKEQLVPSGSLAGSISELPYEVYHPEGDEYGLLPPRFATWKDAQEAQKRFNKELPGHVARRIRK